MVGGGQCRHHSGLECIQVSCRTLTAGAGGRKSPGNNSDADADYDDVALAVSSKKGNILLLAEKPWRPPGLPGQVRDSVLIKHLLPAPIHRYDWTARNAPPTQKSYRTSLTDFAR